MSDYAGIIGGGVGAVVGFWVTGGNPAGAKWGWMIGSSIGGAYAASQQVIPGPQIGEIQQQTAQEGSPMPIVFGRSHPIAGNIIASGEPQIIKKRERQGKGGPKVESESAYRTYAVGFCEGPITAFLQVWRNNTLVYNAEDPGMTAENAEFLKYARFFTGGWDQMPSPDLEAVRGAGNVSAYRGRAYMVLAKEDVTDQRGAWSQWKVRVFRGAAATYTTPPYPVYLADGYDSAFVPTGGSEVGWPIEGYDSTFSIASADLRDLLKTTAMLPEGYDSEFTVTGADLRELLKSNTMAPEGYDSTFDVTSAELRTLLLEHSMQPEGIDSDFTIVSASLT